MSISRRPSSRSDRSKSTSSDLDPRLPAVERDPDLVVDPAERVGVDRVEHEVVDRAAELGPHRPLAGRRAEDHGDRLADVVVVAHERRAPWRSTRSGKARPEPMMSPGVLIRVRSRAADLDGAVRLDGDAGPLDGEVARRLDGERRVRLDVHVLALDRMRRPVAVCVDLAVGGRRRGRCDVSKVIASGRVHVDLAGRCGARTSRRSGRGRPPACRCRSTASRARRAGGRRRARTRPAPRRRRPAASAARARCRRRRRDPRPPALDVVAERRVLHPDAAHVVGVVVLGDDADDDRAAPALDGEPGSSGRPGSAASGR